MAETVQTPLYTLGSDDKVAQVMVYTQSVFYWGEVVVKEMVRVSTWLRTNSAPDRIYMYNAKAMLMGGGAPTRPLQFSECHIAVSQVLAFHITPPNKDPLDYDPTEPNRHMQPVTMMVGNFRIDGHLRLAGQSTVGKFLEVTHERFTSIYEAKISSPMIQSFGSIAVPYLIVRQDSTVFALA